MAILRKDVVQKFRKHYTEEDSKKITEFYLQDKWPERIEFTEEELSVILNDAQLLQKGYPLAQVTGLAHFYGYEFHINEHVLIPRPETEELVEWVLEYDLDGKTILDIGTGSACIPIVLRLKSNANKVAAWEVSREAIKVALQNVEKYKTQVDIELVDVLNLRTKQSATEWDIILSNPPYVRMTEATKSITYEPEIALYVPEEDPHLFYRVIGNWAIDSLNSGGMLFFELSEFTYPQLEQLMYDIGFQNVELRKDLQGKVRMLRALK